MFSRWFLLVLVCLQVFADGEKAEGPTQCCFRYVTHRLPLRLISGYELTPQQCTKPGVMFILTSGHRVCVDPEAEWVKRHVERLDGHQIR